MKETWREMSGWLAGQVRARYGTAVTTAYHNLFDPDCPPLPPDTQLPLVLVDGQVLSSGGKLSMPTEADIRPFPGSGKQPLKERRNNLLCCSFFV